ncbi:hypothetical protein SCA6_000691 [Theobroma cacao]
MTGMRGIESTLDAAGGRPDVKLSPNEQGKRTKKIKNKNRVTGGRNEGLTAPTEKDETLGQKSTQEDTGENSKNNSIKIPTQTATSNYGYGHHSEHVVAESGLGGQNESVDMMEGSGEHSPIVEQCANQTRNLVENNGVA